MDDTDDIDTCLGRARLRNLLSDTCQTETSELTEAMYLRYVTN